MNIRAKIENASRRDDADIRERFHYSACMNGPCRQGRGICPTPEACRLPDDGERIGFGMAICAICAVAVCAVIVVVFA